MASRGRLVLIMPINPNIILGLRQGEYKAPDPLEQYGKAQTLKALITQGDVQDLQAQQLRQGIEDDQAVRQAHITAAGDPNRLRSILQSGGQFKALRELDKADLEKRAKEAAIGKDEADAKKKAFDVSISRLQHGAAVLGTARDQATYDTALKIMARDFGPESVQGMSPTFNPQEVQASIARGLTRAQQLEDQRKVEDARERNRHNLQAERAQLISAGAAASNAQTAAERLKFDKEAPRGVIHEGPNGLVLVDPRTAAARPVTDAGGQPLPAKLDQGAKNDLRGINQQLATVDSAIKLVEKTPSAFGITRGAATMAGAVPESLAGRMDNSEERVARSQVFNIVSKIINERAGAAQSAQELARLRSFLPAEIDSAEQIMDKLNGYRSYLREQEKGTRVPTTGAPAAPSGWKVEEVK